MKEPILEMRGITKTFGSAYTVVPGTNVVNLVST